MPVLELPKEGPRDLPPPPCGYCPCEHTELVYVRADTVAQGPATKRIRVYRCLECQSARAYWEPTW